MPAPRSRRPADAGDSITKAAQLLQEVVDILQNIQPGHMSSGGAELVKAARLAAQDSHQKVLAAMRAEIDALTVKST